MPRPSTSRDDAAVLVGVVAKVHALRGELAVDVRTDSPDERFAVGATLTARRRDHPDSVLTVVTVRPHSGKLLVTFAEVPDRTTAESYRGTQLLVAKATLGPSDDPDAFHAHELEGLRAELDDGTVVGTVREIVHGLGGELLVLSRPELPDALVPFVHAIVPTVDVAGGRVVLTPPEGLLDVE